MGSSCHDRCDRVPSLGSSVRTGSRSAASRSSSSTSPSLTWWSHRREVITSTWWRRSPSAYFSDTPLVLERSTDSDARRPQLGSGDQLVEMGDLLPYAWVRI